MFIETNCKFITIVIPETICKSSLQHFAIELLGLKKENKIKQKRVLIIHIKISVHLWQKSAFNVHIEKTRATKEKDSKIKHEKNTRSRHKRLSSSSLLINQLTYDFCRAV